MNTDRGRTRRRRIGGLAVNKQRHADSLHAFQNGAIAEMSVTPCGRWWWRLRVEFGGDPDVSL